MFWLSETALAGEGLHCRDLPRRCSLPQWGLCYIVPMCSLVPSTHNAALGFNSSSLRQHQLMRIFAGIPRRSHYVAVVEHGVYGQEAVDAAGRRVVV